MSFKIFSTFLAISLTSYYYSYAQKVGDTIITQTDTINIYGKVINEKGEALKGATVISKALDENYNNRMAITDSRGYFFLKGIKPIDTLIFFHGMNDKIIRNDKSRYLLVKITSQTQSYKNVGPVVSAKKISSYRKLSIKRVAKEPEYIFDGVYSPIPALYPDGMNKLYQHLKNNIIYPKSAFENNIEGVITIEFTINDLGLPSDFLVVNDIGYGCSDEAIRVLKTMKKWNPAMNEGKPYSQSISLEIPFKLLE